MAPSTFIRLSARAKDRTGERIGKLALTGPIGKRDNGDVIWLAKCDCGGSTNATYHNLKRCTGCGCNQASTGDRTLVHGHARHKGDGHSKTYASWLAMRARCSNPNHHKWEHYGGRGIAVCDRWAGSFAAFLADMGERPDGMTLDREDANGDYRPGNCRWADATTQRHNRRR